jgi:hypothetical protein
MTVQYTPATYNDKCNDFNVTRYRARVVFGTAAIASFNGKGLTLVRDDVGEYTLTFPKSYRVIKNGSQLWYRPSGADLTLRITDKSTFSTDGALTVKTCVNAGTATEPTSGDELYFEFDVTDDAFYDDNEV